jgi:hypothetical protein
VLVGDDGRRWRVGEIEYPDGESDPDGAEHLFALLVDPSDLSWWKP